MDKQAGEFYARAEPPAERKHPVPTLQPPKNCSFVSNLVTLICHANVQKRGVRLGSDAVNFLLELCIHPVAHHCSRSHLRIDVLRQR